MPLTGKSRIAVHQNRQDAGALFVAQLMLLGTRFAHHNGINRLQVRGVGGQRQMNIVAIKLAVRRRAQMVFDIA